MVIALLISFVGLPLVGGVVAFAFFSRDLPSAQDIGKAPLPQSTKVYDRDGKELLYQFEEERRDLVRYADIPQVLIDATVAAEDHSFFTNPGVDVLGIARAAFADITHRNVGSGGASTLTQQLVKIRLVGNESSVTRKIREAILAVEVTRTYSKQQILELYLNQVYYGDQAYGVKAAAETYFGKPDLKTLTLPEAALLAGLPQLPSILDPTKAENTLRATERRAYVLDQMQSLGMITQAQEDSATAEPIKTAGVRVARIEAPHFVFQTRNQLTTILGGDEGAVTRGGFRVITSLDWRLQQAAEKHVRDSVDGLRDGSNVNNAALASLDTRSGEVLAYVGSVDYNNRTDPKVQGQFDVAGIGERQPGSSFKMFNYVTALKKGATAATVVVDARTDFGGGYRPENADLQYHGPVTMRQAVRESRNIPAIKFLQQYSGIEDTIQTAHDLGITTEIDPSKVGLSLTLGAREVKLVDMVSAYGTLSNLGVRAEPTFILRVEDSRGKIIWEHKDFERKRVLDENIAYVMVDILKDTTQPDRDFIFGSFTNIGRPAGLKTGTTDNLKDVYAVGFTPTLVTGVWMGNSNGDLMRGISSAIGPGLLWRDYMREILEGFPATDWKRPANVVDGTVVAASGAFGGYGSGLLPSSLTPFSTNEIFVKGTEPRKVDDWYTAGCAGSDGSQKVAMDIKEVGPAAWKLDRDRWIREAIAGQHSYGRYSWNLRPPDGTCASPSPSASATPSSTPPGGSTPTPPPIFTPPPTFTLPPIFTPPVTGRPTPPR
ncbi:MAG TPA: transglycosylase domain-containing protein [Candidatus Limnocylindria bacterium]|nr:transglycosylase domain-containing protein [Candidatus Limnocylindria bacterium]